MARYAFSLINRRLDPCLAPWSVALLGFVVGAYMLPHWSAAYLPCLLLLPFVVGAHFLSGAFPRLALVHAFIGWALLGAWRAGVVDRSVSELVFPPSGAVLGDVRGVVARMPAVLPPSAYRWGREAKERVRLELDELTIGGAPVKGRLVVYIDCREPPAAPGDRVRVLCRLRPLSHAANPGGRCPGCSQRRRGIVAIATVPYASLVTPLGKTRSWRYLPARCAHRANQRLRAALKGRSYGIAAALVTGEYSQIPTETLRRFQDSGILHLLAISGLHFAILAGVVWSACRVLSLPYRLGCLLVAACCIAFCLVAGARPSATRACVIILAHVGALLFGRQARRFNTLCFAALFVLLFQPSDLFSAGFQLTFLCVAAMYWIVPPLLRLAELCTLPDNPLFYLGRGRLFWLSFSCAVWCLRTAVVSLTLVCISAPVTSEAFGRVAIAGILLTLINLPLVTVALPAILIGVALPGGLSEPLLWLGDGLLRLSLRTTAFEWLPGVLRFSPRDAAVFLPGLLIVLLSVWARLAVGWAPCRLRRTSIRLAAIVVLLSTVAGCVPDWLGRAGRPCAEVTVLNVGHGLCVVGRLGRTTLMYDAGSMGDPAKVERAVETALPALGVREIDMLLVSHADADHLNAIPLLLERVRVKGVFLTASCKAARQRTATAVLEVLRLRRVPIHLISRGDSFRFGPHLRLQLLHPPQGREYATQNEASLVVRIDAFGSSLLLTGDVERWGLDDFLHEVNPEPVDVLVAPHHGSRAANTVELYERLQPRVVIASATGRWGYPAPLSHLSRYNTIFYITSICGAVTWRVEQGRGAEIAVWTHAVPSWRPLPPRHALYAALPAVPVRRAGRIWSDLAALQWPWTSESNRHDGVCVTGQSERSVGGGPGQIRLAGEQL